MLILCAVYALIQYVFFLLQGRADVSFLQHKVDLNGFATILFTSMCHMWLYLFRFRGMEIDSIGGFDARGFILGPPVALALNIPFFMLRKKVHYVHEIVQRIRPALPAACKVVDARIPVLSSAPPPVFFRRICVHPRNTKTANHGPIEPFEIQVLVA